jgi:hypothetical protein
MCLEKNDKCPKIIECKQMVFDAITDDGEYIHADKVSRQIASSVKSGKKKIICIACKVRLIHVNSSSRKLSHFRHSEEKHSCPFYIGACEMEKLDDPYDETEFKLDWIQQQPNYASSITFQRYSFGSKKGHVNVYGNINTTNIFRFRYNHLVPEPQVFILDGSVRKYQLYRTKDTCDDWIYFGRKCEVEHVLANRGIVAVDMGCDFIAVISKMDTLPSDYTHDRSQLMYSCLLWPIDEFIRTYLPDGYPLKTRPPFQLNEIETLENTRKKVEEARVLAEKKAKEARVLAEKNAEEERVLGEKRRKEMEELYEKERIRNEEESERKRVQERLEYKEWLRRKREFHTHRKHEQTTNVIVEDCVSIAREKYWKWIGEYGIQKCLNNKDDVLELNLLYHVMLSRTDDSTVLSYTPKIANDTSGYIVLHAQGSHKDTKESIMKSLCYVDV